MSGARRIGLAGLTVGLVLAACEVDTYEHEQWIGPHLTYVWDSRFEPCAGTFRYMDGFVPFVADQLEVDLEALGDLAYLWLTPDEIDRIPGLVNGGAAIGRHVFMPGPVVRHELVHLVESTRLTFGGPRFITEGIAVGFEERLVFDGPRFVREDPRPYLTQGYLEGFDFYEPAGAFVAYLLSRYGPGPLFELYERLTLGSTEDTFDRVFAAVYGLDLDAEVEVYLGANECPAGASAIPIPYECTAPTIPWQSADRWAYARSITCEDEDVAGHPGSMFTAVTVDVPADGEYELVLAAEDAAQATVIPCGPCPWLAWSYYLGANERVHLDAGRHALRVWTFERSLVAVSIRRLKDDPQGDPGGG